MMTNGFNRLSGLVWFSSQGKSKVYLDGSRETARVFGSGDDQLVDVRVAVVLEVEVFGQSDVTSRRSDVERTGAFGVAFHRVADLPFGERFGADRDDAKQQPEI